MRPPAVICQQSVRPWPDQRKARFEPLPGPLMPSLGTGTSTVFLLRLLPFWQSDVVAFACLELLNLSDEHICLIGCHTDIFVTSAAANVMLCGLYRRMGEKLSKI